MNWIALCTLVLSSHPGIQPTTPMTLLQKGKFTDASTLAKSALARNNKDVEALEVLSRVTLLQNDTQAVLNLMAKHKSLSKSSKNLLKIWGTAAYRQLRYAEAAECFRLAGESARAKQLADFGSAKPYAQSRRLSAPTRIRFLQTHPLPMLEISVNGRSGTFILDTGASELILDPSFAKQVGISAVSEREGTFAAGKGKLVGLGKAAKITIGQASIQNVPVNILDTSRFKMVSGGKDVAGILGMGVLMQFESTLDYSSGALILSQKRQSGKPAPRSIPMWLAGDHIVLVQGEAKGNAGLFFVDTGLAGMAFAPSSSFAKDCNIKANVGQLQGQGGGGKVSVSPFMTPELRLGPIRKSNQTGVLGAFPTALESAHGCTISAIISHQFFSDSTLTFDFNNMRMLVASKSN